MSKGRERELDGRVLLPSKTKNVGGQDRDGGEHRASLDQDRGFRQVVCLGEDHREHREKYVHVVSSIHWPVDRDHSNGVKDRCRQRGNSRDSKEREGGSLEIERESRRELRAQKTGPGGSQLDFSII